jgi:methyl-accepting chemotaxis protein WspA
MISAIALIFAVIMVLYISRSITQPLKALERIARNVAQGNIKQAIQDVQDSKTEHLKLKGTEDLQRMDPNDELLIVFCAIEKMTANLDSLLKQVQLSGREVSHSADSISESARDLESTIAEQVSSTNEVNATSKEISSTAKDLAETMGKVSQMVTNASDLAFSGISNLTDIKSIMLELKNETGEISDKLELINSKTENISAIITKITKVANRTNLLSLNAAIEAEKAGEHGTGFSVVAREIRLLADETSVAALDIEEMITETQKAVRDGVVAVESYTEKTNRSSSTIASISEEMSGLISHINDLVPKFNSVNEGMQIQSEGADQIKEAMEQLNESARYTKDALMKFRKITDVLTETLGYMNNELSKFQI